MMILPCLHWLTIMNGHGVHSRQEGLATEPACSRRAIASAKPPGDGCLWQVGGATTRRDTWAWGRPYGPPWRITLGSPLGLTPRHPMHHPPLRLINSVEQTRTRPSHGKVLASLSYESLGVCFLVRRQTPVGHVRAHVTRESHQPASHQCGYGKWWRTAAIPDSNRMTQISLYTALNNFVPLHCATWLLVPQTDQIHLPHNR